MMQYPKGKITPLFIVVAFLALTEAILGYAVTKTTGRVQLTLTIFVVTYAPLVAAAFFYILWHRPFVFYSPADFEHVDPRLFIETMRGSLPPLVKEQVLLAGAIQSNPSDKAAQYSLINSLVDPLLRQFIILMHEKSPSVPYVDSVVRGPRYLYQIGKAQRGEGYFNMRQALRKLKGAGLAELVQDPNLQIRLTDEGKAFALWLVHNGFRADHFKMPFGEWGSDTWLEEEKQPSGG